MLPSLPIQSFTDIAHDKYVDAPVKTLLSQREFSSRQFPIHCKILFENCNGQQVLGSCIKLVSEALSPKAYTVLVERVQSMPREPFVGIKICTTILIDLQLGRFQKNQKLSKYQDPYKAMDHGVYIRGQATLNCCVI